MLAEVTRAESWSPIKIEPGQSWLLAGKKRSGKTTGAKLLVQNFYQLFPNTLFYVLDVKNRDFLTWPGRILSDKAPPVSRVVGRVQVWVPEIASQDQIETWQFNIKQQAQKRRQAAVILYDEGAALIYRKGDYSEEYRRIQKVGGGLFITTVTLTQELGGIPPTAYSQAQHFCCWRLQTIYDMTVANTLLGFKPSFGARYSLWYKNQDNDEPAYEYESMQHMLAA